MTIGGLVSLIPGSTPLGESSVRRRTGLRLTSWSTRSRCRLRRPKISVVEGCRADFRDCLLSFLHALVFDRCLYVVLGIFERSRRLGSHLEDEKRAGIRNQFRD